VASQSSSTLWKTSNALIRLRLIFVVLGAWLAAMTISPVAHAAAFTYDVSQTAHVDVDVEISATDHLYPVKGSSLYPVKGSSAIRVERASAAEGTYSTRLTADIATNSRSSAERIADGHAYDKHVVEQGEYPDVQSRAEFADLIQNAMENCTDAKNLSGGRRAYWQDSSGTVVIKDPASVDGGTVFKPTAGRAYFEGLR
jgi:hypothetical protein